MKTMNEERGSAQRPPLEGRARRLYVGPVLSKRGKLALVTATPPTSGHVAA